MVLLLKIHNQLQLSNNVFTLTSLLEVILWSVSILVNELPPYSHICGQLTSKNKVHHVSNKNHIHNISSSKPKHQTPVPLFLSSIQLNLPLFLTHAFKNPLISAILPYVIILLCEPQKESERRKPDVDRVSGAEIRGIGGLVNLGAPDWVDET